MTVRKYFQWQSHKNSRYFSVKRCRALFYGTIAWLFSRIMPTKCEVEPVDVLIFYRKIPSKKSFAKLKSSLAPLSVVELPLPEEKEVLKSLAVARFVSPVGLDFYIYAAYAAYIVNRFQPKVVIIYENGSRYAPFLRAAVNAYGGFTGHLPHSIPTANYRKFSLVDYDYSFVYGMSSIDSLNALSNLYGKTKCIITGPLFIESFKGECRPAKVLSRDSGSCILLGLGPSYEEGREAGEIYRAVILWALEAPGRMIYFKPHPRSDLQVWHSLVGSLEADLVVKRVATMEALDDVSASFAVAGFTNAVIDIANKGVPIVWLADGKEVDYFSQESYFLPRVSQTRDLAERIDQILACKEQFHQRALDFAAYHLGQEKDPAAKMAASVKSILESVPVDFYSVGKTVAKFL